MGGDMSLTMAITQAPREGRRYPRQTTSLDCWTGSAGTAMLFGVLFAVIGFVGSAGDRRMIASIRPLVGIHPPAVLRTCQPFCTSKPAPVAGLRPGAGNSEQEAGTTPAHLRAPSRMNRTLAARPLDATVMRIDQRPPIHYHGLPITPATALRSSERRACVRSLPLLPAN